MSYKLGVGEKVEKVIKKHWFDLLSKVAGSIFVFIIPFIAVFLFLKVNSTYNLVTINIEISKSLIVFFSSAWFLIMALVFSYHWIDHHLDAWILTDERIVDIEQMGFFHRQVSSLRLERIQDVTIQTSGLIATLLHFGDIHVQTAGQSREFILKNAPRPQKTKELILRQYGHAINKKSQTDFTPQTENTEQV